MPRYDRMLIVPKDIINDNQIIKYTLSINVLLLSHSTRDSLKSEANNFTV